jgi:hypothetical protein
MSQQIIASDTTLQDIAYCMEQNPESRTGELDRLIKNFLGSYDETTDEDMLQLMDQLTMLLDYTKEDFQYKVVLQNILTLSKKVDLFYGSEESGTGKCQYCNSKLVKLLFGRTTECTQCGCINSEGIWSFTHEKFKDRPLPAAPHVIASRHLRDIMPGDGGDEKIDFSFPKSQQKYEHEVTDKDVRDFLSKSTSDIDQMYHKLVLCVSKFENLVMSSHIDTSVAKYMETIRDSLGEIGKHFNRVDTLRELLDHFFYTYDTEYESGVQDAIEALDNLMVYSKSEDDTRVILEQILKLGKIIDLADNGGGTGTGKCEYCNSYKIQHLYGKTLECSRCGCMNVDGEWSFLNSKLKDRPLPKLVKSIHIRDLLSDDGGGLKLDFNFPQSSEADKLISGWASMPKSPEDGTTEAYRKAIFGGGKKDEADKLISGWASMPKSPEDGTTEAYRKAIFGDGSNASGSKKDEADKLISGWASMTKSPEDGTTEAYRKAIFGGSKKSQSVSLRDRLLASDDASDDEEEESIPKDGLRFPGTKPSKFTLGNSSSGLSHLPSRPYVSQLPGFTPTRSPSRRSKKSKESLIKPSSKSKTSVVDVHNFMEMYSKMDPGSL